MVLMNELNLIYKDLSNLRIDMFCNSDNIKDYGLIEKIIWKFFNENMYSKNQYGDCNVNYSNLIDLLIFTISNLKKCTNCSQKYEYLLQIDRLECILRNLKKLLCQLNCSSTKDCNLISKSLCSLFKIIEFIINIIVKIKNIEYLCNSCVNCRIEILDCLLCLLVKEVNELEDQASEFAHIVLDIASLNIINCTTCTLSSCCSNYNYTDTCYKPRNINYFK